MARDKRGAALGSGQMLTSAEVAAALHVSPSTIARLKREGDLPAVKIGSRVFFHLSDVEAYAHTRWSA